MPRIVPARGKKATGNSAKEKPPGGGRQRKKKGIIVLETKKVPISSLKPYYKNANIGDTDAMASSLDENGMFKPVVVNRGTKTGRVNEILGGNTTVRGAKQDGWSEVLVSFVDVGEVEAAKINLADNQIGKRASTDEDLLAQILSLIPEDEVVPGTGFTESQVEDYLALLDVNVEASRQFLDEVSDAADYEAINNRPGHGGGTGLMGGEGEEGGETTTPGSIDAQSEYLDGAFQLTNDVFFLPGWGKWDIPCYTEKMLVTEEDLPDKLLAWAGSASRDTPENDDPHQWWVYNFGIDSLSGMKYTKNIILSFYAYDHYFEKWREDPARWTTRAVNHGVRYAISPNFSTWVGRPRFEHLSALYWNRYLGRYFQEAGIKVIPNLEWPLGDEDFLQNYVLKSLPRGRIPVISLQGNTIVNPTDKKSAADRRQVAREYRMVADYIGPEAVVLHYGSVPWNNNVRGYNLPCKVRYVENRMVALGEKSRTRGKKVGL